MYDHDVYVHWQHSKNIKIHDLSYKNAFDRIMIENPCNEIIAKDKPDEVKKCESYMEGVIPQGMTVAFTRHFENMK